MEKTRLEMDFLDEDGKRFRISLNDPKEDLDRVQIENAMNSVIEHNIFDSNDGDLVALDAARIVTTTSEEIDF